MCAFAGFAAGVGYSATVSSSQRPSTSSSQPCQVRILDLVPDRVYALRGASSTPSFSAVPESSLRTTDRPAGTWNRHSQAGLREMVRVDEATA